MYKGKFASELSMSEVKEYYDELREKYSLTKEQWADFIILQERLIVFACKILDGKTNGDVMQTQESKASDMLIKFTKDFAGNWKTGNVVKAKYINKDKVLVDGVANIDVELLLKHCEIISKSEG